ncbi:MAG: Flp pilus assembly complex ATPase component TadA [Candidatus Marinimicrobia bacterium]|nr:Flp pilus assembly complex ATPase component TadA [Candidatus Neomarinimicrobiota bacterium]MBL7022884.1 Flp pilus assembly complex ATPase component TadA [Candidatus Neomarinimicrobiota bacterium]MBL7109203.1 Flp pilus assembly complex ATPase component TadA [Candidatus Neomarinimicrobiota bacterium]
MSNFNHQFEKIGDILVHEEIISNEQLENALSEQKVSNEKLGHILIKQGVISENDLVKAYSLQLGHKHILEEEMMTAPIEVVQLVPEDFAVENNVIALNVKESNILIAMEDPEDLAILDSIRKITSLNPIIMVAGQSALSRVIEKKYGAVRQSGQVEDVISNLSIISGDEDNQEELLLSEEEVSAEDAPFVKLVNLILLEAIQEDSTDIHIEPGKENVIVRIRIDGVLTKIMSPPMTSLNGMVARIKILARLNIAEHRLPQDGRMKIRMRDREIDVRVSILPTIHGEKVVLRLLGSGEKTLSLTNLGFPEDKLKIFRKWINQPYGMVLISGPTGSGKSTTLYASLMEIQSEGTNITTVEDPVEYQVAGTNQVHVNEDIGLTFAHSLRSILRQDPDILLIGEIRDSETADIAVKFSLTGHLVFSTVHANDATSTVTRLLDIGIPPFLLGSSLNLVMAQRLVRLICPKCKEEFTPTDSELKRIGIAKGETKFYQGKGCSHCRFTGYKGRTAIHEILEVSLPIKRLIYDNANEEAIKEKAIEMGMTQLRDAGIEKIKSGETTIYEVLRSTIEGQ